MKGKLKDFAFSRVYWALIYHLWKKLQFEIIYYNAGIQNSFRLLRLQLRWYPERHQVRSTFSLESLHSILEAGTEIEVL